METFDTINRILTLFSQLFRFLGLAVLGLGIGWLVVDLLKKMEAWQGQVAIFLGLAGLIIGMTVFSGWGALGAFATGVGVAVLLWGMPKKEKKEEGKK
jgi:NhaP-type Na+/H+ or K+/H+ antiporter